VCVQVCSKDEECYLKNKIQWSVTRDDSHSELDGVHAVGARHWTGESKAIGDRRTYISTVELYYLLNRPSRPRINNIAIRATQDPLRRGRHPLRSSWGITHLPYTQSSAGWHPCLHGQLSQEILPCSPPLPLESWSGWSRQFWLFQAASRELAQFEYLVAW